MYNIQNIIYKVIQERSRTLKSQQTLSKDSLKEQYTESRKRVKMMLDILGQIYKNNSFCASCDDPRLETLQELIEHVQNTAKLENPNQYREAITQISEWIRAALQKHFLQSHNTHVPHPIFIIKRGVEILHSLLHRDLRRKQCSSEENEIYQTYLSLTKRLPSPKT